MEFDSKRFKGGMIDNDQNDTIDLRDLFEKILRRWRWIVACLILSIFSTFCTTCMNFTCELLRERTPLLLYLSR